MSVISSFSVVYRIGWRNAENYSEIVEISSEIMLKGSFVDRLNKTKN